MDIVDAVIYSRAVHFNFPNPKEIPSPDNELIKGKIDAMPKVSSKEAEIIKMESLKN